MKWRQTRLTLRILAKRASWKEVKLGPGQRIDYFRRSGVFKGGEAIVPAFTLLGSNPHWAVDGVFDLAIVGDIPTMSLASLLRSFAADSKPVVLVIDSNAAFATIKQEMPGAVVLQRAEGWSDALVSVCIEILRRIEAERRMNEAETMRSTLEREAALGRYMLEMRHSLNNALTSVLGNSELLLLEPGDLPPTMISELGTIRNMALRIHETVQRFSSLEKELTFVERYQVKDLPLRQAAVACD